MEADLDRANKEIEQLKTDHEIALERKDKQVWTMKDYSFLEQTSLMEHKNIVVSHGPKSLHLHWLLSNMHLVNGKSFMLLIFSNLRFFS